MLENITLINRLEKISKPPKNENISFNDTLNFIEKNEEPDKINRSIKNSVAELNELKNLADEYKISLASPQSSENISAQTNNLNINQVADNNLFLNYQEEVSSFVSKIEETDFLLTNEKASNEKNSNIIKNGDIVINDDNSFSVIQFDENLNNDENKDYLYLINPSPENNKEVNAEKPSLTSSEAADKLIDNNRVGIWKKDKITYQLNTNNMSDFQVEQARKAFESWNELVNLDIQEIPLNYDEKGQIDKLADIIFQHGNLNGSLANLVGITRNINNNIIGEDNALKRSLITINAKYANDKNTQEGKQFYNAYLHEIGHALGLNHPSSYNNAENKGKPVNYSDNAEYKEDTKRFTILSYFKEFKDKSGSFFNNNQPSTPMLHDIAAIQKLYGKNTKTRLGDDLYKFAEQINEKTRKPIRKNSPDSVRTIYDAGGIDTIDAFSEATNFYNLKTVWSPSWETSDPDSLLNIIGGLVNKKMPIEQIISLKSGEYSTIGYLKNNVAIADGVIIENVITNESYDTITGNDSNNIIKTGSGNDIIRSEGGDDIVDAGSGYDTIIDGRGDDIYTVDIFKKSFDKNSRQNGWLETITKDDKIIFNYDKNGNNGNDIIHKFDVKRDIITIKNLPEDYNVTLTKKGKNTIINYGSGTIEVTNTKILFLQDAIRIMIENTLNSKPLKKQEIISKSPFDWNFNIYDLGYNYSGYATKKMGDPTLALLNNLR